MPDPDTARMDPFREENTLIITCDVIEPSTGKGYDRDPRSLAKRAEAYLKSTGLGDIAYFGPEPEFFIFDAVKWSVRHVGLARARSNPKKRPGRPAIDYEAGNLAHRPPVKGGYFPVPPVDSLQDIRSEMCLLLSSKASKSKCITTKWQRQANARSAPSSRRWSSAPTGCRSSSTRYGTLPPATARLRPSCRSRSSATTAPACTCTSRSGKAARICLPATAMPGLSDFALLLHRRHHQARARR